MMRIVPVIFAGWVVERALIAWLEGRDIALVMLTGPQGDPLAVGLLGAVMALRFALVFGGPPLVVGAVAWWVMGRARG